MRERWIALALMLVGSAAASTGCGVSKVIDPVASAATKTENAGGAKMTMDVHATTSTGQQSYDITASGVFDRGEGDMTLDLSNLLQNTSLPIGAGSGVEIRYLSEGGDPVMYMDFPFLTGMIPGGKTWVRLDVAQAATGLGVDLDQLLSQADQNPAQELDLLRAGGEVEKVGPDTVDGVATTEYSGSIDMAKAAKLTGSSGVESLVGRLTNEGLPAGIPIKVWIDGGGLVRRIVSDETLSVGGQQLDTQLTVDLSDYGTAVSVSAPPADKVFDLTALASAAGLPKA